MAKPAATSLPGKGWRMPAEWEPHAATWLAWPHNASDWPGKLSVIPYVFAELARAITRFERLKLIVSDAKQQKRARRILARADVPLERVDFVTAATDRSWTRDSLPTFIVKGRGSSREVGAVKWRFTGWGRYPTHEKDERAGRRVAELHDGPAWFPEVSIDGRQERVVLEGGAIEVDGKGTLLTTANCLLGQEHARNPGLTAAGYERLFRDTLGITKTIWLPDGIAGDDTSGHVDDFARFVDPGTVVLCEEHDPTDANYYPLNEAAEALRDARDAAGNRLRVVRLPMPRPVVYDGQRLPASYANFLFTNEQLLVPTFNDPADREALGILSELCPERRVVGIYARDLVLGLGTLHCSSQQQPA